MAFSDVSSAKGLGELNTFLADNSYISGYTPSKADSSVFTALGKAPAAQYANIARFYRNIASFTVAERNAWGGQAVPQVSGAKPTVEDDDDVDLFGDEDEEENEEAEKLKAERVAAYAAKKSMKPALIAKSSVILDIKPWDDETDMKEMEKNVRTIEMEGLLWGASKLVPVGYGINKLQICCVIQDALVSVDDLQDKIAEFEDFVQSSDIAAFQKI
ncbi:unnamed protein product [Diamesa hyperborea]